MPKLNERSALAIDRLRAYGSPQTHYYDVPARRRAAVLFLLFADKRGDLRVIVTIRSSTLTTFPGHAALPGGRADSATETPFETARREANEEIGLPGIGAELPRPFSIEHLCEFPCAISVTDIAVRPCVAFLHSYDAETGESADAEEAFMPKLDAKEVAAVFSARFHNFLSAKDEVLDEEERESLPGSPDDWYQGEWTMHNDEPFRMHNFFVPITNSRVTKSRRLSVNEQDIDSAIDSNAETARLQKEEKEREKIRLWGGNCMGEDRYKVWGLTARLLVDAARISYDEEPEFEHNKKIGDEDVIRRFLEEGIFEKPREKPRARH